MKKHPVVRNIKKTDLVTSPPSLSMPPTTTEQEDIVTAGQRRVNILWEATQACIAIMITGAIIYNAMKGIKNEDLTNAFFLIVSMYFVRTNHQLTGGVKSNYKGR